jgi:hypothetical protein
MGWPAPTESAYGAGMTRRLLPLVLAGWLCGTVALAQPGAQGYGVPPRTEAGCGIPRPTFVLFLTFCILMGMRTRRLK